MKYYGKATIYGYHSYELVLVNGELSSVHGNMNLQYECSLGYYYNEELLFIRYLKQQNAYVLKRKHVIPLLNKWNFSSCKEFLYSRFFGNFSYEILIIYIHMDHGFFPYTCINT